MVLKSEMSSLNRKKKNKVLYRDMTLLNAFIRCLLFKLLQPYHCSLHVHVTWQENFRLQLLSLLTCKCKQYIN